MAASVELSIPAHVRQHPDAPKITGYVLTDRLGEGAYGQVWRAWQLRTRKEVAVKIFMQRSGLDWIFLQREVERLSRLDKHPNIVTLLDTNLDEEPPFYVMELVGRGSLQQFVGGAAPVDVNQAKHWLAQIADALSYVHGKGLIHCDLKPANVLIDERANVRVVDFGQSRVFTESAASLGTLFYMAPEQAVPARLGSPIHPDVRWDVYALGATLYAILTGRPPYANAENVQRLESAGNLADRLASYRAILQEDPRPDWTDGKGVDEELRAVVDQCMAAAASDRYATAGEVLADLEAIERKRPIKPFAARAGYRWKKFAQRNALQIGLAMAGVVLVALALWSSLQQGKIARAQASEIMTLFVQDPSEAVRRASETDGAVRRYLTAMVERGVNSPAFTDRISGARAAISLAPQAFWESVDGGPLWKNGEWLEIARSFHAALEMTPGKKLVLRDSAIEFNDKLPHGTVRQKYVAACLAGQIADPGTGLGSLCAELAGVETDPGVVTAASWAAPRLAAKPRRTTSPRVFADDVSGLPFVALPPMDSFRRGSPPDDPDRFPDEDRPATGVRIGNVHMSVTEVTLSALSEFWRERRNDVLLGLPTEEREAFERDFGDQFAGLTAQQSVVTAAGNVPLLMARMYCDWLNRRAADRSPKRAYRLPTEDEWEYACRAGGDRRFCYGDEAAYACYFAHCDGSGAERHTVAERMPNAFGLFDMHGGVWEWTDSKYPAELVRGAPPDGEIYVQRGGAWNTAAVRCRCAQRNYASPQAVSLYVGFRLVMELQP